MFQFASITNQCSEGKIVLKDGHRYRLHKAADPIAIVGFEGTIIDGLADDVGVEDYCVIGDDTSGFTFWIMSDPVFNNYAYLVVETTGVIIGPKYYPDIPEYYVFERADPDFIDGHYVFDVKEPEWNPLDFDDTTDYAIDASLAADIESLL